MKVSKNMGKIFWGLLFILAAVYIVVSKFWILPEISVFTILLAVFFIWLFIKGIAHRNFWEILFSIAFILILFDEPLGITALTPWTVLGAALLGSIGLSMIFKPKKGFDVHIDVDGDGYKSAGVNSEQCVGENVKFENTFGSYIKYINSDDFRSATFENSFGAMSVYFDNAIIQSGTACVNLENNFGEIKLFIPKEWKVVNNLEHSFGSVDEKGRYEGSSNSTLFLNGQTNFGSIEIHYI